MENVASVEVLESSENLIEEELDVLVCENLVAFDDLGEISFQQFGDHVNIIEFLPRFREEEGFQIDNLPLLFNRN